MSGEGETLILALPSKGRMMDDSASLFAGAQMTISKSGSARGYRGEMAGQPNVEVSYVSATEIASRLRSGSVHLGITGEDLVREGNADARVVSVRALGFGAANVVVAVPAAWIDVNRMADLDVMAMAFRRQHGRRVRVATKYLNLTRRFFAREGVAGYRIVESLGATEGAPAAGLAELIVDITSSGATLQANGLRVLDDGMVLASQARLYRSDAAAWTPALRQLADSIVDRLNAK